MNTLKKYFAMVILNFILVVVVWGGAVYIDPVSPYTLSLTGFFLGLVVLLLLAPLAKERLTNTTGKDPGFVMFTKVLPGHAKLKMRGGNPKGVIRVRDGRPKMVDSANILWWAYQLYVYWVFGLHVIGIPFLQYIYTYVLPRYRAKEINGKRVYVEVEENDPGYRTDQVRNEISTWPFKFSGAEIDTIPTTIKGSVQIRIKVGREEDALFRTDS